MDGEDIDSQLAYHRRLTGGYEVDGLKLVAQMSAYPEVLVPSQGQQDQDQAEGAGHHPREGPVHRWCVDPAGLPPASERPGSW